MFCYHTTMADNAAMRQALINLDWLYTGCGSGYCGWSRDQQPGGDHAFERRRDYCMHYARLSNDQAMLTMRVILCLRRLRRILRCVHIWLNIKQSVFLDPANIHGEEANDLWVICQFSWPHGHENLFTGNHVETVLWENKKSWQNCIREEKLLQLFLWKIVHFALHQGREFIAIGALENGTFCTVFSENFHKF
jgi:hypothetical protein